MACDASIAEGSMMAERHRARSAAGFSLVELLVALAVALLVTSAVFAMLNPAAGAFQMQPESADVEQRIRVAADRLTSDVAASGAGPWVGGDPVGQTAPPVFPSRIGRRNADAPGTSATDRLSVWTVRIAAPQAVLAAPLVSASGTASITAGAGCMSGDPSCGFRAGMLAAVFDPSGAWDLFSITAVDGTLLSLQHDLRDTAVVHPPASSVIAEVTARTYFLRDDRATGFPQLMRYDAADGGDIPFVDHVVRFSAEYFGDAEAPVVIPGGTTAPDRVTYGLPPPKSGVQTSAYPPGENCIFARNEAGVAASRLTPLAAQPSIVPIAADRLTDGPWCPDPDDGNRYDADLFRIRSIALTLTVEAAVAALRGPAGPLFTRAGTARGSRLVPDRQVRLTIAPRGGASANR
jgi:prepilin-type N-terminal cleavage/methylation domain-containing protein